MPVTATVISSHNLVYSRYSGIILRHDIVAEMMRIYSGKNYRPGMDELVDLRQVTDVQITHPEMTDHVRQANLTHRNQLTPIKVSFWAETTIAFGMARMFQSLTEALNSKMTCYVSGDRATALAVLNLPNTALDNVLNT